MVGALLLVGAGCSGLGLAVFALFYEHLPVVRFLFHVAHVWVCTLSTCLMATIVAVLGESFACTFGKLVFANDWVLATSADGVAAVFAGVGERRAELFILFILAEVRVFTKHSLLVATVLARVTESLPHAVAFLQPAPLGGELLAESAHLTSAVGTRVCKSLTVASNFILIAKSGLLQTTPASSPQ